jgi:cytosine/uracil/thiamine/allantoin permease
VLPVFKTNLALEKILLPSSKTTESGVVCFFVVWRSVVMTTAFKIEVAQRFFFSQLATLVIYYNFLKLATFQLGVAQGVIILTRRCLSFISSFMVACALSEYRAAHPIVYHVPLSESNFGKFHFLG